MSLTSLCKQRLFIVLVSLFFWLIESANLTFTHPVIQTTLKHDHQGNQVNRHRFPLHQKLKEGGQSHHSRVQRNWRKHAATFAQLPHYKSSSNTPEDDRLSTSRKDHDHNHLFQYPSPQSYLSTRYGGIYDSHTRHGKPPSSVEYDLNDGQRVKLLKYLGKGENAITYLGTILNNSNTTNRRVSNKTTSQMINQPLGTNQEDSWVVVKISKEIVEDESLLALQNGFPIDHETRVLKKLGEYKGESIIDEHQVIVMTYHPGKNLMNLFDSGEISSIDELNEYMDAAKSALAKLHQKNILHNDISPENVLFQRHPQSGELEAHFIDYGFSVEMDSIDYKNEYYTYHFSQDYEDLDYMFNVIAYMWSMELTNRRNI